MKEETSSPTVSTKAMFLSCIIDTMEKGHVMTIDIPGVFMQADIDDLIHIWMDGPMAELFLRVDPQKYRPFLTKENGKQVLYVELTKALYGTLQVALLWWKNLSGFLTKDL